jgi:hypothetical protein
MQKLHDCHASRLPDFGAALPQRTMPIAAFSVPLSAGWEAAAVFEIGGST